ncbi:MAG TPA: hypothetical protein VGK94_11750 [Candidatus Polarisedimenticolia bacterium]|jgi:hypothetical protein
MANRRWKLIRAVAAISLCIASEVGVIAPAETGLVQPKERETFIVKGPMVVGFFSPEVGGDEHLDWGLERTAACLRPKGVSVTQVSANVLIFVDGKVSTEFRVPSQGNGGLGCYLVAPGRKPLVINGVAPSYLVHACLGKASVYFHVPSCCPEGWVCCPDGSLRGEGSVCDS